MHAQKNDDEGVAIDATQQLSAEALRGYRQQLELERQRLAAEVESLQRSMHAVTLDQTSVGRLSRMDAMQQQAMATGLRDRLLFRTRRVGAALIRLDNDAFGRCCECDVPLGTDRLAADPAAPFCPDCQEEIDDRRKRR